MARTKNVIKNTAVGFVTQIITTILSFANRTFFIWFLSQEYLGLGGLFSNILSMLSLAELGIGVAIAYSLYKPLSEKNEQEIKELMNFYKLAYRIIGIVILVVGLCLVPFLNYLIKDRPDIPNFKLIYILFLSNTVVSYFFTYKRSLLSADQKEYKNSNNRVIFVIIQNVGQLLVLWLTKSYILYLIVMILCTIGSNISISIKCDKMYPYLKNNKEKLPKNKIKTLMRYVFAQMSHKVGGIVVSGTDNILTTSMVTKGLYIIGSYSNYLLLINTIKSIISMFYSSATASVGNLNAESDLVRIKNVYNKMLFINMVFFCITTCCIFNLATDFIKLWIGKKYVLDNYILILILITYYINGMRQTTTTFNTTLGLFWNDRFKPWIEAVINLVSSIILLKFYGFAGVLLGTVISTVTTSLWVEPYILYKHKFEYPLKDYFVRYIKYLFVTMLSTAVCWLIFRRVFVSSFLVWIIKAVACVVISFSIVTILFFKTDEFKGLLDIIKQLLSKFSKKGQKV